MDAVLLSVRVLKVNLDPNGPWKQGLLKEFFSTVTSSKNRPPQQEKWYITVAQAPPGPPGEFREVFRSETLGDLPPGAVCPSLVATVRCPQHVDSTLRLRVHYSSKGWTGGKEVVLCEATFASHDVIVKRRVCAPLTSPYLKTPAAVELTVLAPMRSVLEHRAFSPRAPPNEQNPLLQSYVFYRDDEYAVPPPVFVQEHALECRISGRVPEAFLEAVLAALERSKAAWVGHGNLEAHRIRSADCGVLSANDIGVEVGVEGCPPHVTARREWEWLVGMNAADPLAGPSVPADTISPVSSSSSASSAHLAQEVDLLNFDDSILPTVNGDDVVKRHCRYSVPAVAAYVAQLDELADEVREAARNVRMLVGAGKTFRASATKKHVNAQALPLNLHMQVMAVRDLIKDGHESVLDALSCGCFSPHALGFAEKKGLDAMDSCLAAASKKLDVHKRRLVELAGDGLPKQPLSPQPLSPTQLAFVPVGTAADTVAPGAGAGARATSPTPADPVAALAAEVCVRAQECDRQVLAAGRRRVFAMSQALSVAVAAVLMKLTLVAEGSIPAAAALDWLTNGFLIMFEGLLSVIGTERFMLEDTVAAIDGLNRYCVRVLPAPPASPPATEADVDVRGREVLLFLPADALRALPREYARDGGAVLPLTAVLFSQGIDLHQSLALAASSITAIASQAQANVNNSGMGTGMGIGRSPSKEAVAQLSGAAAAAGANSPPPPPTGSNMNASTTAAGDDTGGHGFGCDAGGGLEESAAMQSFQHAINVRALVRLLEHCQQLGGDAATAADEVYGGAAAAKESIDRYRSAALQTASPKSHARKQPAHGAGSGTGASAGSHHGGGSGGGGGDHVGGGSSSGGSGGSGSTLTKAVKASKLAMAMTSVASSALRTYGARLMQKGGGDGAEAEYAVTGAETGDAPLAEALGDLAETILARGNVISKNVDLLVAVERVCVALAGCRVTFCKSGKDRTAMCVTYEQSRRLGERFHCGSSLQRAIRDANVMRVHGVRIDVAEKNIGRRVYRYHALDEPFPYAPPLIPQPHTYPRTRTHTHTHTHTHTPHSPTPTPTPPPHTHPPPHPPPPLTHPRLCMAAQALAAQGGTSMLAELVATCRAHLAPATAHAAAATSRGTNGINGTGGGTGGGVAGGAGGGAGDGEGSATPLPAASPDPAQVDKALVGPYQGPS